MSFSLDIAKFAAKAGDRADLVVRKVAIEAFTRVILRSPVITGRFRGNWQCAIGSVPSGTLEINDKTGQVTISKAEAVALGLKAGSVITLVNNLPYAYRLENGWSKQAPSGMVALTVNEFNQILNGAVNQAKSERP